MMEGHAVMGLNRRTYSRVFFKLVIALVVLGGITIARSAAALPSFARQTGQPCGVCHTDHPGLTPFGRRFKLGGYTLGGGDYRTAPFSDNSDKSKNGEEKEWVPPIAMMTILGDTHTQAALPPPTAPFNSNDNVVLSPFSAFYAGAITDHIGTFAQLTYNAPPPGGFSDPFGHTWTWDNVDVRYADSTKIAGTDVIYGITANNNPTVQDVWNTTPAWVFPYAASTIAPTPTAKTIIDGAFAAHVVGVGGYTFINDMLYLEASAYGTLDFRAQNSLGADPFGAPGLFEGAAPYWRIAIEPHWGDHWLMLGAFGMLASIHPWVDPTFALGTTATFPQTDKYTDTGFDAQYQFQGNNYWLTLRGSYINEFQRLDGSFLNGLSANRTNQLNTLRLQSSFAYGSDNRAVLTGQYFDTWGTSDALLYAGLASGFSPNSSGWIAEIAYIPFEMSRAPGWPWFNARIGLQYTAYEKFDGTTVGARDHNTLFLYAWFAM
jgi:hypothetical protein